MAASKKTVRVAALADLHCTKGSQGAYHQLLAEMADRADVLLICGDLTDYGLPDEAHILARELSVAKVPIVAVLGNHDYESGKAAEVSDILCEAGVNVLDGDTCEFHGIGFAGVKGFGGGFGARMLSPWGEDGIKQFVHEAIDQALHLERALARLSTPHRIVLLHYSPIRGTVEGENPETFPFLGSSRLEEPLGRYPVTAVFHGHAHIGSPEGQTGAGVPVYNVSIPLLRRARPDDPPYRVVELPMGVEAKREQNAKTGAAA